MLQLRKQSDFKDGMLIRHSGGCASCIMRVHISDGRVELLKYPDKHNDDCSIKDGNHCHWLDFRNFRYYSIEEIVTGVLEVGDI